MKIHRSCWVLIFVAVAVVSAGFDGCGSNKSARGIVGRAAKAVRDNELQAFRATLFDTELWGNAEGLKKLRSELEGYTDLEVSKVVALGRDSHAALVTGKKKGSKASEKLLRVAVNCGKNEKSDGCLIVAIELFSCDPWGSANAVIQTMLRAARAGNFEKFKSTLDGEALEELGTEQRMSELKNDSDGKLVSTGRSSEVRIAHGERMDSGHSVAVHSLRVELLYRPVGGRTAPIHDLDALIDCALEVGAYCGTVCKVTGFAAPVTTP